MHSAGGEARRTCGTSRTFRSVPRKGVVPTRPGFPSDRVVAARGRPLPYARARGIGHLDSRIFPDARRAPCSILHSPFSPSKRTALGRRESAEGSCGDGGRRVTPQPPERPVRSGSSPGMPDGLMRFPSHRHPGRRSDRSHGAARRRGDRSIRLECGSETPHRAGPRGSNSHASSARRPERTEVARIVASWRSGGYPPDSPKRRKPASTGRGSPGDSGGQVATLFSSPGSPGRPACRRSRPPRPARRDRACPRRPPRARP